MRLDQAARQRRAGRRNIDAAGRRQPRRARPGSGMRRSGWRIRMANPTFYLKAVIATATFGLLVLPLLGDGAVAARAASGPDGRCRIISVIDGDTLRSWCAGRGVERLRLAGVDTPELYSPSCAAEYARAQAATWALRRILLAAGEVTIFPQGEDRYGRVLARVMVDGRSLSDRLVFAGHGRRYDGGARASWCDGPRRGA